MDRERQLINRLAKIVPSAGIRGGGAGLRLGIGDDAAILRPRRKTEWVLSCDSFLEGTHFPGRLHPPESVGYKSLARAVSDLAAMGARPRHFLLALSVPASRTRRWLDRFASGMARAARELDILLVGGDISQSPAIAISITVLGEAPRGRAVRRSGAAPGDLLYVSGTLGEAELGLELMRRGFGKRRDNQRFLRKHLYPAPRVALGRWLAEKRLATAMIDISDGLSTDVARLCQESRVGAQIWAERIPQVRLPNKLPNRGLDPLKLALHGGEDYELLFTVRPRREELLRRIPAGIKATSIGRIIRQRQIFLVKGNGAARRLPAGGWDHFRKSIPSRASRPE